MSEDAESIKTLPSTYKRTVLPILILKTYAPLKKSIEPLQRTEKPANQHCG